jgi:hypothetical protein
MKTATALYRRSTIPADLSELLQQYGCGPVQLTGTDNGLYERHLFFDNVIERAGNREECSGRLLGQALL